jgi:hypothetical protein
VRYCLVKPWGWGGFFLLTPPPPPPQSSSMVAKRHHTRDSKQSGQRVGGLRALHLLPASCIDSKHIIADSERSEPGPRQSLVQGHSPYCLVRAPYFSQSSGKCAALSRGLDYSGKARSINTFANHQAEGNIDSCIV